MYVRKVYGQSKLEVCPFCNKRALAKNQQGVPVCSEHKENLIPDQKCACGNYLELRSGKWGPYFNCLNCGNINFKKIMRD